MIRSNHRFEQTVSIAKPDKKAPVCGPRGNQETLVLDGKLDEFVAQQSSFFPMRSLKDLQGLLKSEAFTQLRQRQARDASDNWIFHRSPSTPEATPTLSLHQGRLGDPTEITWGAQKATLAGDTVKLVSRVSHIGSHTIEHTILGEKNAKGAYTCVGEAYHLDMGTSGNLWQGIASVLRD